MDVNFPGITTTTFPLFIEIKNDEDGLTFADASLTQQIELILEGTPLQVVQPRVDDDDDGDDDDSNIELGDLLKYKKEEEKPPETEATSNSSEILNCAECSESFETKEIYDIHMSGHANNMKCAICNMVLKSLKNYEKHCMRCKPYECQICGRVVRFRPNFIKHMRVHTTQQSQRHKYKCEVCHKEFMSFEYFKVHKKIHNGNINLTCGICGKVFSALASLRGHNKLHTGIKLHKCDICGKGFGQRYNLKIHSRVHTGEIPFECRLCKRKLHTQSSYQSHMLTYHGEQVDLPSTEAAVPAKEENPVADKTEEGDSSSSNQETILQDAKLASPAPEPEDQIATLTVPVIVKEEVTDEIAPETTLNCLSEEARIDSSLEEAHKNKMLADDNEHSLLDTKYQPDFDSDLVDSSDLTNSLSYSNLFDPGSIPESIPDDIYLEDNDSSFPLDQNSIDLQSTTDGNFIKKEWVYSNYSVGTKFDDVDDDLCEAASFIYD